jgi:tripartite-type tricarboxylate transporter receptor subunit TctC
MKTATTKTVMKTALGAITLTATCLASVTYAQSYPAKPVRIVIGVAAGGLSDTLARGVAAELTKAWGQSVLVENRPGASDVIAAESVAKSAPDGHSIYMTNASIYMINTLVRKNLPFDAARAFAPVHGLVRTSDVLIARPGLPVANVQDLVSLARSKPGALNYGSFGVGSAAHLDAEKFAQAAKLSFVHVPYKGGADVIKAILANDVDFAFTGLTAALPLIRAGKIKALAWGADERSAAIPDVPTLRQSGYDFETGGWLGLFVPAATPAPIIEKISAEAARIVATPEFREKFIAGVGLEPMNLPAKPFAEAVRDAREKYAALFRTINFSAE